MLARRTRALCWAHLASTQGSTDGKSLGAGPECCLLAGLVERRPTHSGWRAARAVGGGPEGRPPRISDLQPGLCGWVGSGASGDPFRHQEYQTVAGEKCGRDTLGSETLGGWTWGEPCPWAHCWGGMGRPVSPTGPRGSRRGQAEPGAKTDVGPRALLRSLSQEARGLVPGGQPGHPWAAGTARWAHFRVSLGRWPSDHFLGGWSFTHLRAGTRPNSPSPEQLLSLRPQATSLWDINSALF